MPGPEVSNKHYSAWQESWQSMYLFIVILIQELHKIFWPALRLCPEYNNLSCSLFVFNCSSIFPKKLSTKWKHFDKLIGPFGQERECPKRLESPRKSDKVSFFMIGVGQIYLSRQLVEDWYLQLKPCHPIRKIYLQYMYCLLTLSTAHQNKTKI